MSFVDRRQRSGGARRNGWTGRARAGPDPRADLEAFLNDHYRYFLMAPMALAPLWMTRTKRSRPLSRTCSRRTHGVG